MRAGPDGFDERRWNNRSGMDIYAKSQQHLALQPYNHFYIIPPSWRKKYTLKIMMLNLKNYMSKQKYEANSWKYLRYISISQ